MSNHKVSRRRINSERLRKYISEKTSIRQIGMDGVWSDKTIRRALKDGEMTLDLIVYLANYLKIPADCFADVPFKYSLEELF